MSDLLLVILNAPTILQGLQNPLAASIAYNMISTYESGPKNHYSFLIFTALALPSCEEPFNCNPREYDGD
jgi:hypothetical protein